MVLVILALVIGGLAGPLATRVDQRRVAATLAAMDDGRDALLGFAAVYGHLPCPDRLEDGDGLADGRVEGVDDARAGCAGGVYEGWLPAATLGTAGRDDWGNRLRYRVASELTRATGDPSAVGPCIALEGDNRCTAELGDSGELRVYSREPFSRATLALAIGVPAVLWSTGGNGALASISPAGEDEGENLDGDTAFVSRDRTPDQSPCEDGDAGQRLCGFDDLVRWVSPHVLYGRIIAAGRLP